LILNIQTVIGRITTKTRWGRPLCFSEGTVCRLCSMDITTMTTLLPLMRRIPQPLLKSTFHKVRVSTQAPLMNHLAIAQTWISKRKILVPRVVNNKKLKRIVPEGRTSKRKQV
jgi:hypothetical protein